MVSKSKDHWHQLFPVGTHVLWITWPVRSTHGSENILVNTEMGHLEFGLFKNPSSIKLEHLDKLIPFILCIEEDSFFFF